MIVRHTRQGNLYNIQWRPYTRRRVWLGWKRRTPYSQHHHTRGCLMRDVVDDGGTMPRRLFDHVMQPYLRERVRR